MSFTSDVDFATPERVVPGTDSSEEKAFSHRRSVRDSAERVRRNQLKKKSKKKKKKKKIKFDVADLKEISNAPKLKVQKSKRTLWVEKNIEEHSEFIRLSTAQSENESARSSKLTPLERAKPRGSGFMEVKGGKMETPKPIRFMDSVGIESRLNYRTTKSSRMRQRGLKTARQSNEMWESQKIHSRRSVSRTSCNILPETKDAIQSQLRKGEALKDVKPIHIDEIKHRDAINYWREFRKIRFYRSPTVTRVIGQILKTVIPEIGVTYQTIIDEFLGQPWPISIFLHGGLLRDIMTSTIGNDVDITFSCSHFEMKEICDEKGWKSEIREDIPYWVVGGASHFETKLEGFPLSFNGLAPFHVQDFASNTIYYDCKNDIIIDRYGKGVDAALRNQITLPVYSKEDWDIWRTCDFVPGVKMYRFYKFVVRGFDYDIEEAKYVQGAIAAYVVEDQDGAIKSAYHALRDLARGQNSYKEALKYKEKLKRKVVEIYVRTYNADQSKGVGFWEMFWEKVVDAAIAKGTFVDLELYEAEPSDHNLNVVVPKSGIDDDSDMAFETGKIHMKQALYKQSSLPSSPQSNATMTSMNTATSATTSTLGAAMPSSLNHTDVDLSDSSPKILAEWSVNFPMEE